MNRKGFASIIILVIVVIAAALVGGGFLYLKSKNTAIPSPSTNAQSQVAPSESQQQKSPSQTQPTQPSAPIVQDSQTYFNRLNNPGHGFSDSPLIEYQWNVSKISSNASATLSVDCQTGVIFFDMAHYQPFECGDVARIVGQFGAANIYVINNNPAPVQITGILNYGGNSFVTTSSIAATPPVTGKPSVIARVNSGGGPINAGEGSELNTSWMSTGVLTCFNYNGEVRTTTSTNNTAVFSGGAALPGPTSGTGIIELLPLNRAHTDQFGVSCITPTGSIVSSSVQINVSISSFSVVASPSSPNPEKISSNGKRQLLGSFDITAGSNPVTITNIWIDGSADVASSGVSISNLEVAVTPHGSSADIFGDMGAMIHSGTDFFFGTSTISASSKATLQIYGDITNAHPGTYKALFTISGIRGNVVGSPHVNIALYDSGMNGKVSGQDVSVNP